MCYINATFCIKCGDINTKGVTFCRPNRNGAMCTKKDASPNTEMLMTESGYSTLDLRRIVHTNFEMIKCQGSCPFHTTMDPGRMQKIIDMYSKLAPDSHRLTSGY